MNLRWLLKYRNGIYGFSALIVVLYHVWVWVWTDTDSPAAFDVLNHFLTAHPVVDIFLFLSGVCLSLSMKKREDRGEIINHKAYLIRRMVRLGLPYLMITVPYLAWKCFVEVPEKTVARSFLKFFGDASSATFWVKGTQTTWFVFAIALFYILFPFIYKVIRKRNVGLTVLLFLAALLIAVLSILIPGWRNSAIAWSRLPIFVLGCLCGYEIDSIRFPKNKAVTGLIIAGAWAVYVGVCLIYSLHSFIWIKGFRWMIYGAFVPVILICFATLLRYGGVVMRGVDRVFGSIGAISLELYLVHVPILHVLRYMGVLEDLGGWNYILVPVISMPIAFLISWICGKITQKMFKKSKGC